MGSSCRLGCLALILALATSDHFILLTSQQSPTSSNQTPLSITESPPSPPPQTPLTITEPPIGGQSTPTGITVGAVIGSVVIVGLLCTCLFMCIKRRTTNPSPQPQPPPPKDQSNKIANRRNLLPVNNNSQSQSRAQQSLAPTVPSQQVQQLVVAMRDQSNRIANSGNPLPVNNPQSRSRAQPSLAPIMPSRQVQLRRPPSTPRVHTPETFTYEELESATDRFSESNFVGRGGFGTVYKGVLRDADNKLVPVAIKKLNSGTTLGMQQFLTEIEVISRAHHRHIVSLVGYFIDDQVEEAHPERPMMLVYEFIPNNSLEFHLHGKGTETMDWETRMKIAIGSAKGLAYLHEGCNPKIIHSDIKTPNILLDDDFQPKIADFGLAQLLSDTETHVSKSRVMGTFGYLAPEYIEGGKISEKSDVFAFGVVLLELIAGRKPRGTFTDGMVKWARPLLSEAMESGDFEGLADAKFRNDYNVEEMSRMVSCAANCIRHSATRRPRMSEVVDALEGKIILDNGDEVSTQVDNEYINKLWKRALSGVDSI